MNLKNKNEEDNNIIIKLDDGTTKSAKIVFAFNQGGDDFIVYELEGKTFASTVDQNNNLRILDEKEREIVEEIYNNFLESESEVDEIN